MFAFIFGLLSLTLFLFSAVRKLVWNAIWHTVRFFLWHPRVSLAIIIGFLLWVTYGLLTSPGQPTIVLSDTQQAATPAMPANEKQGNGPITYPTSLPPLPAALENGNSKFAPELLHQMSKDELSWYSKELYHVLEQLPAGQEHLWAYDWAGRKLFGKIVPGASFQSSTGLYCRPFQEILVVQDKAQTLRGNACQRRAGGWCKLRPQSSLSCDLGSGGGFGQSMQNLKRKLFNLF